MGWVGRLKGWMGAWREDRSREGETRSLARADAAAAPTAAAVAAAAAAAAENAFVAMCC